MSEPAPDYSDSQKLDQIHVKLNLLLDLLEPLRPLIPHVGKVLAMLDSPAWKWKGRGRAVPPGPRR